MQFLLNNCSKVSSKIGKNFAKKKKFSPKMSIFSHFFVEKRHKCFNLFCKTVAYLAFASFCIIHLCKKKMQNFAKKFAKYKRKFSLNFVFLRYFSIAGNLICNSIMSYTVNSVNKDGWMQDAMNIKHERQGRFIKV